VKYGITPALGGSRLGRNGSGLPLACLVILILSVQVPLRVFAQDSRDKFDNVARQATAAREQNDVPSAIELYDRAVEQKPDWPDGWWFLGMLHYGAGEYTAARDALTHYIDLTPKAGPAVAVRGLCEFELGDYPQSLVDIRNGLALGAANQARNESVLRYREALLLTLSGDFEGALREYVPFAHAGVTPPEMLIGMGLAGLRIPILPKDLRADQRDLVLASGSAASHMMAGDAEKGRQDFQVLFEHFPATTNVHYLYGYLLFAGDPDEATEQFRRELEIAPANAAAHVMLAWGLLLRNDYSGALPYAEKAVAEAPTSPSAQLAIGRALVETGDLDSGLEHLDAALKLDPDNIEIHLAMVRAYSKSGRKEDAKRERLLSLNMTKNEAPVARP
jgi:tetratricopeptide (TPR) repeat protein